MLCYVCDSDNFFKRHDLNPESTVCVCKECGNIQHIYDESKEKEMLDFYRNDYRRLPGTQNLITTTRKLNYIKPFLHDWFKDKKDLITCDIGCATGYLPNFFKHLGHKALGTEYTTTYRRFAEHYYGIPITEEIETKHKYDFISFYHTLEHMMCPDKKLIKHRDCLNDKGVLFISVPNWLNVIEDLSAFNQLTIQNYFHKNHVCCFTEHSFKNLMNKCGLNIIKQDTLSYGISVLAEKCEPKPIIKQDYNLVLAEIDKVKKAIKLFSSGMLKEAVELYPKFPAAWVNLIFDKYRKDEDRQKNTFIEAEQILGDNLELRSAKASWHYQFGRYEEAFKCYDFVAQYKMDENILMFMGWCMSFLGDKRAAIKMFDRSAALNPQKWQEASEHICKIASSMLAWDEVAAENLKEELFKKHAEEKRDGSTEE